MRHLSLRKGSKQPPKPAPCHWNPAFLDEKSAGVTWHRCIEALDISNSYSRAAGVIRVGPYHAQIHAIYHGPRHLVRFWVRTEIGNHLLISGSRQGLLPLNQGAEHV